MNIKFSRVQTDSYESTVDVTTDDGREIGALYRENFHEGGHSSWAPDEQMRAEMATLFDSGWGTLSEAKRAVRNAAADTTNRLGRLPVYFHDDSDEPLGVAIDAAEAEMILRKEISTWHGYAMPAPKFKRVKHVRWVRFYGEWQWREPVRPATDAELTNLRRMQVGAPMTRSGVMPPRTV